jgi:hypothetical protein
MKPTRITSGLDPSDAATARSIEAVTPCHVCLIRLKAYRVALANFEHTNSDERLHSVLDAGKGIDACMKDASRYLH